MDQGDGQEALTMDGVKLSPEELDDLVYEARHDYDRYVQENRGDLLQKHERPDPEVIEKYRLIWEKTYRRLMDEIGGPKELREYLRRQISRDQQKIKRQK